MRRPILLITLLALPVFPALAQGFPGATVGIPMGKPDPFGSMTGRTAEPITEPSADREAIRPDRRVRNPSRRYLGGYHRAGPKRRPPLARR